MVAFFIAENQQIKGTLETRIPLPFQRSYQFGIPFKVVNDGLIEGSKDRRCSLSVRQP